MNDARFLRIATEETFSIPEVLDAMTVLVERGISSLKLNGVIINSHTNGEFLDDPKYWPIFESAQALNAPIYIHPRTPPATMYDAYADYSMSGALWGFAMETFCLSCG